jgi:hypothetical protein
MAAWLLLLFRWEVPAEGFIASDVEKGSGGGKDGGGPPSAAAIAAICACAANSVRNTSASTWKQRKHQSKKDKGNGVGMNDDESTRTSRVAR